MKVYNVRMPIAGFIDVTVGAESKEEALDKFYDINVYDLETMLDKGIINHYEWDYYEIIVGGNVLHVTQNKVSIEEE